MGNQITQYENNLSKPNPNPNPAPATPSVDVQGAATINTVNQMIAQANDAIICGPSCKQQQKLDNLKQTYINAQTNLKNAPQQLMTAKKNYYLELDGKLEYNKIVLDKVTKDATKVTNNLKGQFQKDVSNVTDLIKIYQSLLTNYNYMNDLAITYAEENIQMAKELKRIRGNVITNDRRAYYKQQQVEILQQWYFYLKIAYILLLIIVVGTILFREPSWFFKLIFILFFVFYPMFITPMLFFLYELLKKINRLLPKFVSVILVGLLLLFLFMQQIPGSIKMTFGVLLIYVLFVLLY